MEIKPTVFAKIVEVFGSPDIDLFATYTNAKCSRYVSWRPDPNSFGVDAFTMYWGNFFFYAFPPFSLILRCLNKIIVEEAEGIIVVPKWETQPWYPIFRKLLVGNPLAINAKDSIIFPFRNHHSYLPQISLEVGLLSGRRTLEDKVRSQQ